MATPTRLANKTQWALMDIIAAIPVLTDLPAVNVFFDQWRRQGAAQ